MSVQNARIDAKATAGLTAEALLLQLDGSIAKRMVCSHLDNSAPPHGNFPGMLQRRLMKAEKSA